MLKVCALPYFSFGFLGNNTNTKSSSEPRRTTFTAAHETMINAASFHPFFFKVKANVQSSPLFAKTLIYFSLFFALPLNVLLKLDEKTLFCPFDVFTRFQWYRTFSSLLYVNSGFIGALFNAYISYRFISDFERSLGSFRCFWQILFTLVCINCWTFVFSVVFAPFSGGKGHLLSPLNISGPGVLSATYAMCVGNIARNSSTNSPDAQTTIFGGLARVPNSWLPFVFLFFWYVLGNNLVEGASATFVALRYLPRMCGPNGVPTAVQAKRFESTTRFGRYALETHGYVDIDGLQRGFSLPVVVGSGGGGFDSNNNNTSSRISHPERASSSFSGTSQKVGSSSTSNGSNNSSSSTNTSGVPAPRENVHVVRMREERERKQQQQQQQQQQQRASENKRSEDEKKKAEVLKTKPETREERARVVAEALEKRLLLEKEEKEKNKDETNNAKEEHKEEEATTPTPQQEQQKKKKSKLRSPFRSREKKK
jgi:hypothetical protein